MIGVAPTALCAVVLTFAAQVAAATAPTPASVRHDIETRGAKAVVQAMSNAGSWDRVEDEIASGSPAWIELVPLLSVGTDAGSSEGLSRSLVRALPKSPAAVLGVLDVTGLSYPRSPDQVCSASFYDGDRTNIPRYRIEAIFAVSRVRIPALAAAKRACLARLRRSVLRAAAA